MTSDKVALQTQATEHETAIKTLKIVNKELEEENRSQAGELAELQEKLKSEQEEKERLAAIWSKELEEERSRPWYKRLFG